MSTPPQDFEQLLAARFGTLTQHNAAESPATGSKTIDLLMQHRTHRSYLDQPISQATLDTILACTLSAPSKSDLQQVSIVQVEQPDLRQKIAALIPAMPWIGKAPVFLIFLADGHRIERICQQRGLPFANDNLDNFVAAISDASLALQNTITAAEAMGIGTCPISVIRDHMATIAELLQLPSRVVPLAGLCMGYPARTGFVSMRLPPAVVVHKNRYDQSQMDENIDAYDQRRDERFSIPTANQKYTDKLGVAEFYGWSEDKARQMSKPERAGVGDFVRAKGFSLS
ncbi:MAG: nitroreductase family protein [Pseudomonadales bacterium]|nr:nitroreductase family protein [Pseudomonadales bacterium]